MGRGRSEGSGGTATLLNAINNLPPFLGDDDQTKNLIAAAPANIIKITKSVYRSKKADGSLAYHQETIDIAKLETEQLDLYKDNLKYVAQNELQANSKPIRAVRYQGHIIIYDGNHRTNIEILKKKKRIKLMVADLD